MAHVGLPVNLVAPCQPDLTPVMASPDGRAAQGAAGLLMGDPAEASHRRIVPVPAGRPTPMRVALGAIRDQRSAAAAAGSAAAAPY